MTGMVEGTRERGRLRVKYMDGLAKLARGNMLGRQFIIHEGQKSMEVHDCQCPREYGTVVRRYSVNPVLPVTFLALK